MRARRLAATMAVVGLLAATATVDAQDVTPAAAAPLALTSWQLEEMEVAPGQVAAPTISTDYLVTFLADGSVAVGADCNRATGSFTATDDGSIGIQIGATTRAACPADSLSDVFLQSLDEATRYLFDSEGVLVLELPSGGGFVRLAPSLIGLRWGWTEFQSMNDTSVRPEDPEAYTIEFRAGGEAAILADCNRGSATYVADGGTLEITLGAFTLVGCPEESLSDMFLRDLEAANSYVLRDGRLFLALPKDGGIYVFQAVSPDLGDATPGVDEAPSGSDAATPES